MSTTDTLNRQAHAEFLRRLLATLDTALAPTVPPYDPGTSREVLDRPTNVTTSFTAHFED